MSLKQIGFSVSTGRSQTFPFGTVRRLALGETLPQSLLVRNIMLILLIVARSLRLGGQVLVGVFLFFVNIPANGSDLL